MAWRGSFAQLDQWAAATQRRLDIVVKQSVNDLLKGIEVAPGIARGGSRQRGTVPRDTGALAASLQSSLNGSTALGSGSASYTFVVGSIKAGDTARFSWGGGAAPYARAVHFGANGVPGTHWIDVAAGKWPQIVAGAVAKAKARTGG